MKSDPDLPSSMASAASQALRVSAGRGSPAESIAAPPKTFYGVHWSCRGE